MSYHPFPVLPQIHTQILIPKLLDLRDYLCLFYKHPKWHRQWLKSLTVSTLCLSQTRLSELN